MQALQQQLWSLAGPRVLTHVGDLAWWLHRPPAKRRLWLDGERCVAWAWLHAPATLDYSVQFDDRDTEGEVVEWFESEAEGEVLTTYVLEGDALDGYEPSGGSYTYFVRELDNLPAIELPGGFTAHTVAADDFAARVAVHRAAWAPSRLTEDLYRHVMQTWPYRADLDCVVEAPDGTFASYVLCWYDDANRVGELEPMGTHPDFRRQGLGAAVCAYALTRLRAAGAEQAIVYADDPAARALYESVGFRRHTRAVELRKLPA
jgi:ribosomal protein S18 acetylase RimI-like enzyme